MIPASVTNRIGNLLVAVGPMTTLAISPWFNFDPINPIKVLILVSITSISLGLLLPYTRVAVCRTGKLLPLIALSFLLFMTTSLLLSGADFGQQIWGVFGRNTGFLTYLSLMVLFFLTAIIKDKHFYKRIILGLLLTTAIMVSYCLVQVAKLDPVNWSAFYPFGTLGNVNFLSGFLGMALVPLFIFATLSELKLGHKTLAAILFFSGLFVLLRSDSTQGFVALSIGIGTFTLIWFWQKNKWLFSVFLGLFFASFVSLVLALFNQGPLRSLIYQFTTVYRADYMHAGLKMMLEKPWTGVGLDSYDDWYRVERGTISAFRTTFNRTANSAHNIFLDVGAGGGAPLLIAYLSLNTLVLFYVIRGLRRGLIKDPVFLSISMSWLAYQVQATVSINQVGVGVWGWILGGAAIGYVNCDVLRRDTRLSDSRIDKSYKSAKGREGLTRTAKTPNTPPPLSVLASFAIGFLGFALSYMPLKADSDFFKATRTGSAETLLKYANHRATNAFLLSRSLESSTKSGLSDISSPILERLVNRHPRNLFGQLTIIENPNSSPISRQLATQRVKQIDPYLANCLEENPIELNLQALNILTPEQKLELAQGWGLVAHGQDFDPRLFDWSLLDSAAFRNKIDSFCRP